MDRDDISNLRLRTVAEVSKITHISRASIYRAMQTGDLPSIKRGRMRRIADGDLKKFIDGQRQTTTSR